MNVRSGNVDVETERRLVQRRHEIEEPIAEAHGGCRLPVVPSRAVRNHDQHHARGRERESSDLQHGNLHPHDAVNRHARILCPRPQSGQVDSLKERTLHDGVRDFAA